MQLRNLVAGAALLATPQAAPAAVFPFDVTAGAIVGSGAIEVGEAALARGGVLALGEYELEIVLFGQRFTAADDALGGPYVEVVGPGPRYLGFTVDELDPVRGVQIEEEGIAEISFFGELVPGPDGRLTIGATVVPTEEEMPAPVPLPATLPLALGALLVLPLAGRRRAVRS